MEITVKLYGLFAYELNKDEFVCSDIKDNQELDAYLKSIHPVFKETPFRMALNDKMISGEVSFKHADQLAVMPPFSGG